MCPLLTSRFLESWIFDSSPHPSSFDFRRCSSLAFPPRSEMNIFWRVWADCQLLMRTDVVTSPFPALPEGAEMMRFNYRRRKEQRKKGSKEERKRGREEERKRGREEKSHKARKADRKKGTKEEGKTGRK